MGISRTTSTPEYDPYDLDIKLREKIKSASGKERDSIKNNSQDVTTIKTLNLTNVRKLKTDGKKPKIWSVSNFDFNYSYIQTVTHNPLIENEEMRRTRGALGYTYAPQVRPFEPFRKLIKSNSPWLALIKEINLNPAPSQLSFKADVFRQFGAVRPRNVGGGPYKIPETYNKYFTFDRYYILQWNLTRSINIDFNATNFARIDEPIGRIDTKVKKDSVRKNLFKGGRNTKYMQEATVTYNVPTNKIPLLDWTSLRASYNTKYNWLASSLMPEARALGNSIANTQTRTINGELKFEELYNKSRFLRAVNTSSHSAGSNNQGSGKDGMQQTDAGKGKNKGKDKKGELKNNNQSVQIPGLQVTEGKFRYDTIRNKAGKIIKIKKKRIKKIKQPKELKPLPEISRSAKSLPPAGNGSEEGGNTVH
ncbi:MAG: cell surface protein SprA [Chitinophagaceae bacterium]|nr:cell surface protein SprA [Chitinophagaceae bacterium]